MRWRMRCSLGIRCRCCWSTGRWTRCSRPIRQPSFITAWAALRTCPSRCARCGPIGLRAWSTPSAIGWAESSIATGMDRRCREAWTSTRSTMTASTSVAHPAPGTCRAGAAGPSAGRLHPAARHPAGNRVTGRACGRMGPGPGLGKCCLVRRGGRHPRDAGRFSAGPGERNRLLCTRAPVADPRGRAALQEPRARRTTWN